MVLNRTMTIMQHRRTKQCSMCTTQHEIYGQQPTHYSCVVRGKKVVCGFPSKNEDSLCYAIYLKQNDLNVSMSSSVTFSIKSSLLILRTTIN